MNVVAITVIMLRNVIEYGIMMGTYGFKKNHRRSTTTTRERKPSFCSR
jgi:hypothetical protein